MDPEAPLQESRRKIWGKRLLQGAVAALTLYLTYHFVTHTSFDWSRLARRVAEAKVPYVALGMGLLLSRYAIWDWRFRLATRLAVGRRSGVVLGFFVLMASAALNLITPTARVIGGLMRARYFARAHDRPFGFLYGVVLYDQVAHHVVMSACTWITLIATAFALGRNGFGAAALGTLAATVILLVVWSRRDPSGGNPLVRFLAHRAERAEGRLQSLFAHGHEAVGVFVRLLAVVPLRFQAAVLGVVYFLVNAAAQWALFLAIDVPVNPFVVVAVVSLGTAAGTLSGAPGGLGATEIAMMASFKLLGVDESWRRRAPSSTAGSITPGCWRSGCRRWRCSSGGRADRETTLGQRMSQLRPGLHQRQKRRRVVQIDPWLETSPAESGQFVPLAILEAEARRRQPVLFARAGDCLCESLLGESRQCLAVAGCHLLGRSKKVLVDLQFGSHRQNHSGNYGRFPRKASAEATQEGWR